MKSIVIRYGLIGSVVLIGLGMINWLFAKELGYNASQVIGYLSMFIALSMIYLGIRHYRNEELGGTISFGKAFSTGLWIALIPAICMFFYTMFFFKVWGEDFMEWAENDFRATMSPEEFDVMMAQMQAYGNPDEHLVFQGFVMFATVFIIGVIVSLVSAMVLKNDGGQLATS